MRDIKLKDINICQDAVFKAIFTKDSPESREALRSLLAAFLGRELTILTVITNEPPITDLRDRQIRFDIAVRFNDGELANVEMTMSPKRAECLKIEYHLARLFVNQDIKGKDKSFKDLKPAYQLSFLDGNLYNDAEWFHRFVYYDPERHIALGGRTTIIIVELKKLERIAAKSVREMSSREEWAVFLKYYREAGKDSMIREIIGGERGIAMAEQVIQGFTETEIENLRETWRIIAELDRREAIYEMKEDARAEGLAEGREQGLTEGSRQSRLEIARGMKAGGLPIEQITRFTRLSWEEISDL